MRVARKIAQLLAVFASVGTRQLAVPTAARAQATLQKALAAHLRKVSASEAAAEDPTQRKVVYGDVEDDGVFDAAGQYTLATIRGNGWGQRLAVFRTKKGVYRLAADEVVGGKFFRSFQVVKIIGREIIGQTWTCPGTDGQSLCEKPLKKQVRLQLASTKLREK